MFPTEVPVFVKEDILIDPNNYEDGNKRTAVGWLKELFLYEYINKDEFVISADSRKNYQEALDIFRKESKIVGSPNDWEDKQTPSKLAKALNKTMRKLGYTEIEDVT